MQIRPRLWATVVVLATCVCSSAALGQVSGYYRFPAERGDVLVFASEGDLWRAAGSGGSALRLTSHPEEESHPAISPDGRWLAFDAEYDGPSEVYVMPLAGGAPTRLTFEGGGTTVRGWTPDGKVLFESARGFGPRPRQLKTVDPAGRRVETLPLAGATEGTFGDDGRTLYFTRFGLGHDNAQLYRGGAMEQLWRYRLGDKGEAERLAAGFDAPIRHPMWWQGRVYFVSDRSGDDNLWSVDADGGDLRQHTHFTGWQLRNPSMADGRVLYQRGADLFRFDLRQDREEPLPLTLVSDRDYGRLRWLDRPLDYLEASGMGARGESVALTARGRVAVVFPGPRRRVELAIPPEARARAAVVGPEGTWVYLVLDQDRIGEIWRYPSDGRGPPQQLTHGSSAHIWSVQPAPDGRHLVYDDQQGRLWSLDLEKGESRVIDQSSSGDDRPFHDFAWSPDGRYLAYSALDARSIDRVVVQDLDSGQRATATSGKYPSYAPAFSSDGRWLYFISERHFDPDPPSPWGDRNMGPAFDRRGKLYALQLDPGAPFPFAQPDELSGSAAAAAPDDGGNAQQEQAEPAVVFDGLAGRLWEVPVGPGNYDALAANDSYLYLLERNGNAETLESVAIDPRNPAFGIFADDVEQFALSADGSTLFYRTGGSDPTLALVPARDQAPRDLTDDLLRVGDWRLGIDQRAEWRQILLDAWRLHRDFAFDPKLRGLDWDAVLAKYLPLAGRVGYRSELDDLLAQMVAELGILHSDIVPGDLPYDYEGADNAFLGAELTPVASGLRIDRIDDGERDLPSRLGPLRQPGVDVREGDVLAAVDGRPVHDEADLSRLLDDKAGQQVRLDLLRDGARIGAVVVPVEGWTAARLRYRDWVQKNREKVAAASGGRIGYLHLRAMGRDDLASFVRDFYELYDKDGLIIDVRGNRGGSIDSWILATLLRRVWAFWETRLDGPPTGNMPQTFRGHLAVLIDQDTYSDGETFAAGIRTLGLGTLIGERTAGAGIWLSDRNRLSDQGMARAAEYAQYALDGSWLIEGHGVVPDVAVANPPHASFLGADAQLEAAIRTLEGEIQSAPLTALQGRPLPAIGAPSAGPGRRAGRQSSPAGAAARLPAAPPDCRPAAGVDAGQPACPDRNPATAAGTSGKS
ncbi:tricorn protease [Tistlia consotensis]|uniref:Tricorn protease homolog n=1 Tax=Tistlia consotensis USBA 355 TaxID=560819 RepID=A0A1Y6BNB4_9PROT|nr:S41 family peptidase [Tistlia consotensis]SMF20489.1 tricorn protease [Tistlia consotensis USBA 355]SNR47848.1 tricorn protease [Tistlia consotensis]